MIIGPKFKIARRLGSRVFTKTQTTKFSISGSANRGKTTGRRPRALSEYGTQLLEKQKARYTYGLKEHQFRSYVRKILDKRGEGNPASRLYRSLELRLDNVVFRLGLAPSRFAARQLITHKHFLVNDKPINIPSYKVKIGDKLNIKLSHRELPVFQKLNDDKRLGKGMAVPNWLALEDTIKEGKVVAEPALGETEAELDFGTILEFYSRV